jgi:hypothetical protein
VSSSASNVAAVHSAAVLTSRADMAPADATDAGDQPLCDPLGCGVAPPDDENDIDPAPVPYTMWAAISKNAGLTFSQPLQVSAGASAPADPNMLTGTDDTSVIALSNSEVFVGWGQWPTGVDQQGLPLNLQGMFAAVKIRAFTHS